MVMWVWCLSPMDDHDGGPLRADVSLFRFPTARIYCCVLASRLLSWFRMFLDLGIPVAPSYRLSGLTLVEFQPPAFSYLVRKFCCQYCFNFWLLHDSIMFS